MSVVNEISTIFVSKYIHETFKISKTILYKYSWIFFS